VFERTRHALTRLKPPAGDDVWIQKRFFLEEHGLRLEEVRSAFYQESAGKYTREQCRKMPNAEITAAIESLQPDAVAGLK